MRRVIGNFGRSICLFVPTLFCLYATNLYALNIFRFVYIYRMDLSDKLTGIRYGVVSLLSGLLAYFVFFSVWWGLLNIWKNHPEWLSPKGWADIFISWLIATSSLYIAFFFEPSLWIYANVFMSSTGEYSNHVIETTFFRVLITWLFAVNIGYLLKDTLSEQRENLPQTENNSPPIRQNRKAEISSKEQELIGLVRDRKTANRLIEGLKRQYPDRSRLWLIERAISDIHRDRRAY